MATRALCTLCPELERDAAWRWNSLGTHTYLMKGLMEWAEERSPCWRRDICSSHTSARWTGASVRYAVDQRLRRAIVTPVSPETKIYLISIFQKCFRKACSGRGFHFQPQTDFFSSITSFLCSISRKAIFVLSFEVRRLLWDLSVSVIYMERAGPREHGAVRLTCVAC